MPDGNVSAIGASDRFFDRLPPHIHAGFTDEQRTAIAGALGQRQGVPPSINLRLSFPVPPGRIYLAIIAGRDRRGRDRRHIDRRVNPLRTMGNFIFVIAASVVFYAIAAGIFWLRRRLLCSESRRRAQGGRAVRGMRGTPVANPSVGNDVGDVACNSHDYTSQVACDLFVGVFARQLVD